LTFRANQTTGPATFPLVTLTGSATSTIEVLNNSFTGPAGTAQALIQSENSVLVDGNHFTNCGLQANCLTLSAISNATVTNNTFVQSTGVSTRAGISIIRSGGATITGNAFTGGALSGTVTDTLSYRFRLGGIAVSAEETGNVSNSATAQVMVSQNSIDNAAAGIRVVGGGATVTATDNVVSRTLAGLRLENSSGTPSSLAVTHSDFSSYFTPILAAWPLAQSNTLAATCNSWGSANGPQNLAVGVSTAWYLPFAPTAIANGAGGTCNGTNASASSDGVYARARQIGAFMHTDRAIVVGPSVTTNHTFTDGT